MTAGDKLAIAVKVERASDWAESVQFSGYDLPTGATVGLVTVPKGANAGTVELTLPKNLKAGTYTFILHGAGQVPRDYLGQRNAQQPRGANVRVVYPSNAITLTVAAAPATK